MKFFFKYFLLFVPTFLASIVSNEIKTVNTRVESIPYSLLYVKPSYRTLYLFTGLMFPLIFFIQGYSEHSYSLLLLKYTIVLLAFLSGLWIISKDYIFFEIRKAARIFFWVFFIIALIQNTNILEFLDPIFSYFFSKGGLGSGESYRGASILYSEPARASFYVLFIYIIGYGHKIRKIHSTPFLILIIIELALIRATTGYFLILFLILVNFPIRSTIATLTLYLIFIFYQIFEIPNLHDYHYKIDYILKGIVMQNENILNIIMVLDGERLSGIIFSVKTILSNPLGVLFKPELFEPVSGRIAVSGPLLFLRTFGVFGLIYVLFFIRSTGYGSYSAFFYTILIGSLYSPNASCLVLLAASIEYKNEHLLKHKNRLNEQ